jgi:hypothetical protein
MRFATRTAPRCCKPPYGQCAMHDLRTAPPNRPSTRPHPPLLPPSILLSLWLASLVQSLIDYIKECRIAEAQVPADPMYDCTTSRPPLVGIGDDWYTGPEGTPAHILYHKKYNCCTPTSPKKEMSTDRPEDVGTQPRVFSLACSTV